MDVAEDEGRQSVSRQDDQHFIGVFPPKQIVLGTPRTQSRKDKCQVVLTGQLFTGRRNAAQSDQHLIEKQKKLYYTSNTKIKKVQNLAE